MAFQAFFLPGPDGSLFAIYHAPDAQVADLGDLIFVPPFAEEMNRSRRMVALQARALSGIGVGTLLIDLHGTGDSQGEFGEARWDIWLSDIVAAARWLQRRGRHRIGLWGLRLGALLAVQAAALQAVPFDRLILWQPVIHGGAMLTQFLRAKIAATLADKGARTTTRSIRNTLASGFTVEIAGYDLAPEMSAAIDGAELTGATTMISVPITWLELTQNSGETLSPQSVKAIELWRGIGVKLNALTIVGQPFWSLPETTIEPALIKATCRAVAETWT